MKRDLMTMEFLMAQCETYPQLQPEDLLKGLHQSVFGCGHFVDEKAEEYLRNELEGLEPSAGPDVEPLAGDFCRVHLRYLSKYGLAPRTLFRLFWLSGIETVGSAAEIEEKLEVLLRMVSAGRLPMAYGEVRGLVEEWCKAGYPACHHSERFRGAYKPAYRVIRKDYARLLPLFAAIDRKLAEGQSVLLAIEGGAAAGKSTLAQLLNHVYDCSVVHMDDFFLRPEQRTRERLEEAGGNVDRERFLQEVLLPLSRGETVQYRRYNCANQTVEDPKPLHRTPLTVVEGAYSMHPELRERYDLSVFLKAEPLLQRQRIRGRNSPDMQRRFFEEWIPMENRYFAAMGVEEACDLVLDAVEREEDGDVVYFQKNAGAQADCGGRLSCALSDAAFPDGADPANRKCLVSHAYSGAAGRIYLRPLVGGFGGCGSSTAAPHTVWDASYSDRLRHDD